MSRGEPNGDLGKDQLRRGNVDKERLTLGSWVSRKGSSTYKWASRNLSPKRTFPRGRISGREKKRRISPLLFEPGHVHESLNLRDIKKRGV